MFPLANEPDVEVIEGPVLCDAPTRVNRADAGSKWGAVPIMGNPSAVSIPDGNIALIGGTGMGKTVTINHLAYNVRKVMSQNDVMVVLVTKPSLLLYFVRPGDIVINDPRAETDALAFNLIAESRPDGKPDRLTAIETAQTIIGDPEGSSENPYFRNAAAQLLAESIYALAANPASSNADLIAYWARPLGEIQADLKSDPHSAGLVQHIEREGPQTQGVLSQITKAIGESFTGRFAERGTLSLRQEVRRKGGRTIFISYKPSEGKATAPLIRIIFDLILKEALAIGERALAEGKVPGRVFVVLDEVRLLPRLRHLEHALNFGRELGVRVVFGLQNFRQLEVAYREESASLLSGCPNLFAFNVYDGESRDYVKGLFGRNRKRISLWGKYSLGGIQEQLLDGYVVEDWDLVNLCLGECIVRLAGQSQPCKVQISPFNPASTT